MDGQQVSRADVEAQIGVIKARMPQTYRSIQDKAARIGRVAFALVRRSIAGEPNLFYAIEGGHVIGTPFTHQEPIAADVAQVMVKFRCRSVVIWAESASEDGDGTH